MTLSNPGRSSCCVPYPVSCRANRSTAAAAAGSTSLSPRRCRHQQALAAQQVQEILIAEGVEGGPQEAGLVLGEYAQ